jgi:hypothetical protein
MAGQSEEYMGNDLSDRAEGTLNFGPRPNAARNSDSIARDLVHLAAELFGYVSNYAAKTDRTMKLAKKAIEGLKLAHERIRIADSENRELSDRLQKVTAKLQDAKIAMEQMATRMVAAEARANKAENTIRRIGALGILGRRGRWENTAILASARTR